MDVDIRLPLGLLFIVLGALLTVFGLFTITDTELYIRSLGVNINLWTGVFMMFFGLTMLLLRKLGKKSAGK